MRLNSHYITIFLSCLLLVAVIDVVVDSTYLANDLPQNVVYFGGHASEAVKEQKILSISERLAKADIAKGESIFKKCVQCHMHDQSGKDIVGPNLFQIHNKKIASKEGYVYSGAMLAKKDERWTEENLDAYLKSPKDFARGNKMSFAGISDPQERADLIAFITKG